MLPLKNIVPHISNPFQFSLQFGLEILSKAFQEPIYFLKFKCREFPNKFDIIFQNLDFFFKNMNFEGKIVEILKMLKIQKSEFLKIQNFQFPFRELFESRPHEALH